MIVLASNLLVQPFPYICRDDIKQMNTSNLKSYAPNARQQFISAIRNKLQSLGITEKNITETVRSGDFLIVQGSHFPLNIESTRNQLVRQIEAEGFEQIVEQAAYTWFNRLCAIRFMELHEGYLEHGYRVLSHPERSSGFQILDHAMDMVGEFGLDEQEIVRLKLDSSQEETLYRTLLLAQCAQLHQAMPFLFDAIDSITSLLLPDYLTRTDSIIYSLVHDVPEEDWQQVESIGWLYQFYISEKKDQVIGSVVKSEDIPAATQLFTPNWIVKYMVQNSLGRYWLQTYPDSLDKTQLEYYIEPAEQSSDVVTQLRALTPDSIDPLSIKVIDPACGSGHILVEAYNLLKMIYEYRGERGRDIPALILNNNLFGLDIDDRAAQLTGFALMMMARADDRRIFSREIKLNVCAMQNSDHLNAKQLWRALNLNGAWKAGSHDDMFGSEQIDLSSDEADTRYQLIHDAIERFHQAKTFGSLIEVPHEQEVHLKELKQTLLQLFGNGDSLQKPAAELLLPIVHQAWTLSQRYDSVIANPPYMGSGKMNAELKDFSKNCFPDSKSDLFAMFMERAFELLNPQGFNAQVNMQSWMFLSSYEDMRKKILDDHTLVTMAHLGAKAFGQISGEVVQTTTFIIQNAHLKNYQPTFFRLVSGNESEKQQALKHKLFIFNKTKQDDFKKIPGCPIAYWVSKKQIEIFESSNKISDIAVCAEGTTTGDVNYYLKMWFETSISNFEPKADNRIKAKNSNKKWFPYNKGGEFRKWYGNNDYVINWLNDGLELKQSSSTFIRGERFYFREGITWSKISSGSISFRRYPVGFLFDTGGLCMFSDENLNSLTALLNSKASISVMSLLSPTLNFTVGTVSNIPYIAHLSGAEKNAITLLEISKSDWNAYERSWDFAQVSMLITDNKQTTLIESYSATRISWKSMTNEMQKLEEANNQIYLSAYGLQDELTQEVPLKEITLTCNPRYRYGGEATDTELEQRLQSDTIAELISYAVGCMMGRYSLDREGLVYAHAGNEGFKALVTEGAYKTFAADDDGILPILDEERFPDDVCARLVEFVRTVWDEQSLLTNLDFIAESLRLYNITAKNGESSIDTIRRYLSNHFFKDHHLRGYKNRPIYWLFSSGKNKAFECLVYLHRLNENTLPRMCTEYVLPLLSQFSNRIGSIDAEVLTASTVEKTRLNKEKDILVKKHTELQVFDAELKHHIEQKITIDLDDGVKENYREFAKLLAEVKKVTGSA